ncbi:MAG: DUF1801 domain-containing protein [Candidatus Acidiferrales bacterium]|jgi:uncharacterized protein YdhG (YjbR/CyaY superfamily)
MKKTKSATRSSAAKPTRAPKNIDEYLAAVPEPARSTLSKLRVAIRSTVPAGANETISYGIPAFKHKVVLVWFAAFSDHCSLFPTAAVIEKFKNELKAYSTSKGTIQFPANKPLPIALIKKMVKARVSQADSRKRS